MLGSLAGAERYTKPHQTMLRAWALALTITAAAAPAWAADDAPAASPVIATAPMQDAVGSNGLRTGENGRLHPFGLVDLHWVTNPGFLPPSVKQVSDLLLVARVGFDGLAAHSTWDLGYILDAGWSNYFGVQQSATTNLSGWLGHANIHGLFNKGSDFVLKISGDLVRAADVGNQTITQRLWHWLTTANAAAEIRPGGGALVLTPIFGYFWDKYDADTVKPYPSGFLDNQRLLPELRIGWQFLPKTSLFISGAAQITYFGDTTLPTSSLYNIDSDIFTASIGLAGSLTPKVTTLVQGGYTNTFTQAGSSNLQTGTGAIIFNYGGETVKFSGGAMRQVNPASLFRYLTVSRAFIKYDQQLATRTVISIAPEINLIEFGPEIPSDSTANANDRIDLDYGATVSITQALGEWVTLALTDHIDYRTSNFTTALGPAEFFFNDVFLSLRLRY